MSAAAAVILFAAITMYAIFGGADFGAGFWDLVAGGAKRGQRPREVIDHAIAPVWEATTAAVAAGLVAAAGIFVLSDDAEFLFDGLTSRALPLVVWARLGAGKIRPLCVMRG